MEIIALFFLELFVLFLFSRMLQRSLSLFVFQITKSMRITIYSLALVFLPGTIIHEVSHYLMARLLFVPVGKMELIPKQVGEHVKLGSVSIGKADPFRRLLIGIAPFLAGTSLIIITLFIAEQNSLWSINYATIAIFYVLFEIGNSMFSSRKDLEGAFVVLIILLLCIGGLYLLRFNINLGQIQNIFDDQTIHVFYKGTIFLLFPLGLDLGLITALTISNRLLSR